VNQDIFKPGMAGSAHYRIPSLLRTSNGSLLALAEARMVDLRDPPNKVNVAFRRSTDDGKTWSPVEFLAVYAGEGLDGTSACNFVLLEDRETGVIWIIFNYMPGVDIWTSQLGTGFDTQGRKLLFDEAGKRYILLGDGTVTGINGEPTVYHVDKSGGLYEGKLKAGNISLNDGKLRELFTTYLRVMKSEDDGLTWSEPVDITSQVKKGWMRYFGSGPGIGIQLARGRYKSRLLAPMYFSNEKGKMSCCAIYSDDHGETWRCGVSPNDGRIINGVKINAKDLDLKEGELTECQLVERADGHAAFYMRNHSGKQRTAIAESSDGGETWGEIRYDETLLDPTCQSSIIRVPGEGNILVWANPADEKERIRGTLRISNDDGKTWPNSTLICGGDFMYSCLAYGPGGVIDVLYETDHYSRIVLKRFDLG
jgi:sialidase-1